jgi:hypothetical protein
MTALRGTRQQIQATRSGTTLHTVSAGLFRDCHSAKLPKILGVKTVHA